MSLDYTRLLNRLEPPPDGESAVRHRSAVVTAVNLDGTADITMSGLVITGVSVLDGANVEVADVVQVIAWTGDLLVLGRGRPGIPTRPAIHIVPFSKTGVIAVLAGTHKLVFQQTAVLKSVTAALGTAPTGADAIFDLHKNGTTVFTTQANRPTITATQFISGAAVPDVVAVVAGDALTVDIDQVGSSVAGADLTVTVEWEG